ncbi:MAG: LysR family transcriptional regulator [Spirulinaceae cyanobacterium SM2_1_0]|nr:LysR family transcriptional regulator [Spirulinaceae cyanobacterium SM2_1_0]
MSAIDPARLKVSQLRALVAVAECGNFSSAALNLELSQSTISHAIANLEAELGVVLLKRGRNGARLTPIGERIVTQAEQVLQLLAEIAHEANRAKGLQGGHVRIACFRSVATHLLPSAIARLQNLFPEIQISLVEFGELYEIERALLSGQADVGVSELLNGLEFEAWEICEDDYVVLLPPDAPLKCVQLTWAQLAEYPLAVSAHDSCGGRIRRCLQTADVPLQVAYEIREDSTIIGMVQQGLSAAILPRMAAEPIPDRLQVCRLPCHLSRTLGAAVARDALHTPAVYAFLDALRETGRFSPRVAV